MLDVSEIKIIEHDVLVVGAGGAGLSAAIEASAQGVSTGIVMKSLLGKAHTVMAEGGMVGSNGAWPSWWPNWIPPSPSLLILVIPGLFRFTCYYYRKAYYRAFTGTPPACAVGALPRKRKSGYRGEKGLMRVQNLHRYAMYFAPTTFL